MSSNRRTPITRTLLALCLAASAAACASTGDKPAKTAAAQPLTPTERFSITVTPQDDQILLAPHPQALSDAQASALQDLAARWRDAGSGPVRIQTPAHGGEDSYRATALIQDALYSLGVRPDQVQVTNYDPGPRPHPPIVVGFTRYAAKGPQCGRDWSGFTHSANNDVNSNFGCANTANIAAMIANPADLMAPHPSDPADAARRSTVLTKYRQGQTTSTQKDDQANGAISNVSR
jgi:pilus assembly protein CpaD